MIPHLIFSAIALGHYQCPESHNELEAFAKNVLGNGRGAVVAGCCDAKQIDCYQAGCSLATSKMRCCGPSVAEDIFFFMPLLARGVRGIGGDLAENQTVIDIIDTVATVIEDIPESNIKDMKNWFDRLTGVIDGGVDATVPDLELELFNITFNVTDELSNLFDEPRTFDSVAEDLNGYIQDYLTDWVPTLCRSMEKGECEDLGLEWCYPDIDGGFTDAEIGAAAGVGAALAVIMLAASWEPALRPLWYVLSLAAPAGALAVLHNPNIMGPGTQGSDENVNWRIQATGAALITVAALHMLLVGSDALGVARHASGQRPDGIAQLFSERYTTWKGRLIDTLWGAVLAIGIAALAIGADPLGIEPEEQCTKAAVHLYYCGDGYPLAVAGTVIAIVAAVAANAGASQSQRTQGYDPVYGYSDDQ